MQEALTQFVRLGAHWVAHLQDFFTHIGRHFGRREMQERALQYLIGLLSPLERKNGWQLAEAAGHGAPYSMQHLLDRAKWDTDGVRDDLTDYVVQTLGQSDGVLVVDETGFIKKGIHSAGVQRQYSGTAGRIENCQIGVFLAYASARGRALMDRELYLPQAWANDTVRRTGADIPEEVVFATKPELARRMIERAVAAQVPFQWITGDEVYGDNRSLRVWLEQEELHYVLALAANQFVWPDVAGQVTVAQLGAGVGAHEWVKLSAGNGAKGPRWYDWARVPLLSWQMPGQRWLLLRRSLGDGQLAYYVCYGPRDTDLSTLVRVAGTRWTVEECFEAAKGQVGLDQYEVRSWHGWYRHITLAMFAHAYLAALCAQAAQDSAEDKKKSRSRRTRARKPARNRIFH